MNPDPDPTDGLPSRAALARELLRYKMEDYSENGFCASWLVDLEFELWEAAARDSPSEDEMFTVNTSRECRLLATGSTRSLPATASATAGPPRVVFGALAEDRPSQPFHAVSDEGVGNNTRGRVCSPGVL